MCSPILTSVRDAGVVEEGSGGADGDAVEFVCLYDRASACPSNTTANWRARQQRVGPSPPPEEPTRRPGAMQAGGFPG